MSSSFQPQGQGAPASRVKRVMTQAINLIFEFLKNVRKTTINVPFNCEGISNY